MPEFPAVVLLGDASNTVTFTITEGDARFADGSRRTAGVRRGRDGVIVPSSPLVAGERPSTLLVSSSQGPSRLRYDLTSVESIDPLLRQYAEVFGAEGVARLRANGASFGTTYMTTPMREERFRSNGSAFFSGEPGPAVEPDAPTGTKVYFELDQVKWLDSHDDWFRGSTGEMYLFIVAEDGQNLYSFRRPLADTAAYEGIEDGETMSFNANIYGGDPTVAEIPNQEDRVHITIIGYERDSDDDASAATSAFFDYVDSVFVGLGPEFWYARLAAEALELVIANAIGGEDDFVGDFENMYFENEGFGATAPAEKLKNVGNGDLRVWLSASASASPLAYFIGTGVPGGVSLSWLLNNYDGVLGFDLGRSATPSGPFVRVNDDLVEPAVPNEYVDYAFECAAVAYYSLASVLADGSQSALGSTSAAPLDLPEPGATPLPPTGLEVDDHPADRGTQLDLRWLPSPTQGIEGYLVHRRAVDELFFVTIASAGCDSSPCRFTDRGLIEGEYVEYVVEAIVEGVGSTSEIGGATPVDNQVRLTVGHAEL